jgi:hypothetical protein
MSLIAEVASEATAAGGVNLLAALYGYKFGASGYDIVVLEGELAAGYRKSLTLYIARHQPEWQH